jgi:hypothetical protein
MSQKCHTLTPVQDAYGTQGGKVETQISCAPGLPMTGFDAQMVGAGGVVVIALGVAFRMYARKVCT